MEKADNAKINNLKKLLNTIVKNAKQGKTTNSEMSQIKNVLRDTLGREPITSEINSVIPL